MTNMLEAFWKSLCETVEYHREKNDKIYIELNCHDKFIEESDALYKSIKNEYMDKDVKVLDRHKIAAICIVKSIEVGAVQYRGNLGNKRIFLGSQMFATEVALSWMVTQLNARLEEAGLSERITSFYMPEAFICHTNYFEIFSRSLYYAPKLCGGNYNTLDIAEKLFLLEYITLIKNGIDPTRLRDY